MMRLDTGGVDFECGAAKTSVGDIEYMFLVCLFEAVGTASVRELVDGENYPITPPLRAPYT